MSNSTLADIQILVRQIVQAPTESQLSTATLNTFINMAIQTDFGMMLKLMPLRGVLKFYTQPGVDTYETTFANVNDPLYDFKNRYTVIHPPVYIAGVAAAFTQWRDEFYSWYPQTNYVNNTQIYGDGTVGPFVGRLNVTPILQNNVIFTCLDTAGTAMVMIDVPVNNVTGNLIQANAPAPVLGSINYLTGDFTVTFPAATQVNAPIFSETQTYQKGIPISMLYYENKFTIRPVPDKAYQVEVEADMRPLPLLAAGDYPQLANWWEFIAYLAAKKIFQRRLDYDSIALIQPDLEEKQALVESATNSQKANSRSQTIFTSGNGWANNWFGNWPY